MNIIRLSDGKVYREDQLQELLRDEGVVDSESIMELGLTADLFYGGEWGIAWRLGPMSISKYHVLDPSRFLVLPSNYIQTEKVKACYDEIRGMIDEIDEAGRESPLFGSVRSAFSKILEMGE